MWYFLDTIAIIEKLLYKNVPSFLPTKIYPPEYLLTPPQLEEGVEFFSRFENANLKRVVRVSKFEYELYLSEDYDTSGHYHWFYFKTYSTLPKGSLVQFKIMNMIKPSSLYSVGFRPFTYSVKSLKGWIPDGELISYTPNDNKDISENMVGEQNRKYHTLQWSYRYENTNDEVYFSQFIPYTYSDLLKYLESLKSNESYSSILRIDVLCKSLAKNACPMLTITENADTYLPYYYERELSLKSKNTRKILENRVEKLKSRLVLKQLASKMNSRCKKKTKPFKTPTDHTSKLYEVSEPEFNKNHDIECIFIILVNF